MQNSVEYVGFWWRLLATVIDNIWLCVLIYGLLWWLMGSQAFTADVQLTPIAAFILYVLPIILVLIFWQYKSATPGKMLLRMKIVDAETHTSVAPARLLLLYFAYIVSILPLGLGFVWAAFDAKKQCFHDKIAKTVVIFTQ